MNEDLNISPSSHISGLVPTGTVIPFCGIVELAGWTDCDGKELSRTEYSNLFSIIRTTYGEGDGSTTFNVPDFRNKTIWGDTTPGIEKEAGLPNITGSTNGIWGMGQVNSGSYSTSPIYNGAIGQNTNSDGRGHGIGASNESNRSLVTSLQIDASKSNAVYGKSATVQPPAITVRMLIKL